ncbi:2OG-Fe(II) oxygenase family protein [Luteimonas sp. FCS-9]|uniref:2OG-Fe(II) oxygenase n=1 Tax=Luteimonas sp. FCS-9 TaxID=1547516 RepID=UPI00069A42EA|nr:2OG-Fe(II) oxygenase family protein [Luteimonas sp. FCS-9]
MSGAGPADTVQAGAPVDGMPPGPRHDLDRLRSDFARDGHVVVPQVLADDFARALRACLLDRTRWALVTRIDGRHRDFDAAAIAQMEAAALRPLQALVFEETRRGMQYLYERFPVHDVDYDPGPLPPALDRFRALLGGGPLRDLVRAVTGVDDIDFGDAQATRYRAGHFLTRHDDDHPGKQRRLAYVLGLSPGWRADDGGQLQFLDADDRVTHALVPGFNTLALFRVPRPHLVTAVSPFVESARLSITGWWRAS